MGVFILLFIGRIAYDMTVEFPLMRLLSIEKMGKSYNYKIAEILMECHSLFKNGMDVFGSRLIFFCLSLLFVLGIECVAEKCGEKMYL